MGISDDIRVEKTKKTAPVQTIKVEEKHEPSNEEREILSDEFFKSEDAKGNETKNYPAFGKVGNFFRSLDKRYLFLLLIPICIIVILQNLSSLKTTFSSDPNKNTNISGNNTVYDGEIIPQDYTVNNTNTTASNTAPAAEPAPSPAPTATENTSPTSPDKASIKIKLLNGNGINGSAASVRKTLETSGFTISIVKNASNFNYKDTIVYYKTGQEQAAELAKAALSSRTVSTELSDSITGSYTLVIVIGKN